MTDISKHPLLKSAYELCLAIEGCGASPALTNASAQASSLMDAIDKHLDAPREPVEGCALEAVHTGEGWCLQVSYPEGHESHGEAIALLEWPESWPESVDGEFLRRAGFEVV